MLIPLVGIVAVPLLLWLDVGIAWLLNRLRTDGKRVDLVRKGLWSLSAVAIVIFGWVEGTPKGAFKRLVMSPIPDSISDIHWNGLAIVNGRFLVSFQAATEDVLQIIRQRGFEPDTNAWWYGHADTPVDGNSRSENVNRSLANQCRMLNVPFQPLREPEVFKRKGRDRDDSEGLYLITDRQRRKVYVVLTWG